MPGLETTLRRKQYHLAMQKYFSVGRELRADRFHDGLCSCHEGRDAPLLDWPAVCIM